MLPSLWMEGYRQKPTVPLGSSLAVRPFHTESLELQMSFMRLGRERTGKRQITVTTFSFGLL